MPRDLNPESLRAAYAAMHKAYGPGNARTNILGAAITAYLAAEEARGWAMRPRVASLSQALEAHKIRGSVCRTPGMYESIYTAMWDAGAKP